MATTSTFAGTPLPPPLEFGNIFEFDISLKYNFTGVCVGNDEIKESATSVRGFVNHFTITEADIIGSGEGLYLVGDLEIGNFMMVIADRETGEITDVLGSADETVFEDALFNDGAQVTKFLLSEERISITTLYNSYFTLEIDGYLLQLAANISLRYRFVEGGISPVPTVDMVSTSLFGEGFTMMGPPDMYADLLDEEFDEGFDEAFMVLSGNVKATGTVNDTLIVND